MSQQTIEPLLEESVEIDAPPVKVWALVSDLPRLAEWSPQVVRSFAHGRVELGTRLTNLNRKGVLFWPTRTVVTRFEPHREIAFKVKENSTTWSYALEPSGNGGTRLVHRREAPDGLSAFATVFTERVLGGIDPFTEVLVDGMRETVAAIKAESERA